jgi:hypothetical protein
MKKYTFIFLVIGLFAFSNCPIKAATPRDFYWIKIYHCSSTAQLNHIDQFLENTYLPFLHQSGIKKVGVFAPIGNDTSSDKRIFVWIPLKSLQQLEQLDASIEKLDPMGEDALIHLDNKDSSLPYNRIESMITKAFKLQPQYETKSNLVKSADRIFEYRSYESATENMHLRKVHMFNEGGEIALFKRLNFNAIFYSKAITGSRTPNLIYMTSFNNMADRDAHWKTFGSDPEWKKLSAAPEYLKTVSRNETILMTAKAYADF